MNRSRRTAPILIVLMFLGFISLGLPDGLLGTAWPSIAPERGVPLSALGQPLLAFTAGFLVSSVLSGRAIARMGVGVLLAISTATTASSLAVIALGPVWILTLAGAALLGIGGGAIDAGLNAYAAQHASPRVTSWLHASYGVGATLGPLTMTGVFSAGGPWQLAYLIVAGGQFALALAFSVTHRRWRDDETPAAGTVPAAAEHVGLRVALRTPMVWLSGLVFLLYTGFEVAAGQWSFTLLTTSRGMSAVEAGQAVSLYWFGLTFGRILTGIVANRVAPTVLLRAAGIGAVAGSLLLWLGNAPTAAGGLLLIGFSLAPIYPALIGTTAERVGAALTADTVGLQVAAASIGSATLPWLVGQAIEISDGTAIIGPAVMLIALIYFGLSILLELRTRARMAAAVNR